MPDVILVGISQNKNNERYDDCEMDEKTIVTLTNPAAEALESRRRNDWDFFLTHVVAVYAAIMATIAIIVEIVLHFL